MKVSKEIENKDARKLQRFLDLKKFFSFPWILASDILFSKRDFLNNIYKIETAKINNNNKDSVLKGTSESKSAKEWFGVMRELNIALLIYYFILYCINIKL